MVSALLSFAVGLSPMAGSTVRAKGPGGLDAREKEAVVGGERSCRAGLYLCPTEVNRPAAEDSDWLLVDVRSADEYGLAHIPGSINIVSTAIQSKAFLRGKKIVLVDVGYSDSALKALRDSLVEKGFGQVCILDGGLNAWRQLVGPLAGDPLAQRRLDRITAEQFFPEAYENAWAMIDVSGWNTFGDLGVGTSAHEHRGDLREWLSTRLREQAPDAWRILIVNEDGTGYEAVEQAVAKLGWINVFYLEGGKRAYEAYLETQQAMWDRKPGKQGATARCGVERP